MLGQEPLLSLTPTECRKCVLLVAAAAMEQRRRAILPYACLASGRENVSTVRDLRAVWEPSADQRQALVRRCRWLTGDTEAAEDLAQETLLEAWRHLQQLRDPQGESRWLAAIARNVYFRWRRLQGREYAHRVRRIGHGPEDREDDDNGYNPADRLADAFDLEFELERDELAELLDRALALLPPDTRQVLIEHYIRESPVADVATNLGANEAATAKKLQRGKLAFRRHGGTPHRRGAHVGSGLGPGGHMHAWHGRFHGIPADRRPGGGECLRPHDGGRFNGRLDPGARPRTLSGPRVRDHAGDGCRHHPGQRPSWWLARRPGGTGAALCRGRCVDPWLHRSCLV